MADWYRRLADVPQVGYAGSPGVDRSQLPEHNAVPRTQRFTFEGKQSNDLYWETDDGETSAAPATRWQAATRKEETPAQATLRQLRERLELPGDISDYHFLIQQAHQEIWAFRSQEAWVLAEVEALCWLDIRLVSTHPVHFDAGDGRFYYIIAFERLIGLYEREGYLLEALAVAQQADKWGQQMSALEVLQARVAQLELEGAS